MKYKIIKTVILAFLLAFSAIQTLPLSAASDSINETVKIERVSVRSSTGASAQGRLTDPLTAALSAGFSLPDAWAQYTLVITNSGSDSVGFRDCIINVPENSGLEFDFGEPEAHKGKLLGPGKAMTFSFVVKADAQSSVLSAPENDFSVKMIFESSGQSQSSGGTISGGSGAGGNTGGNTIGGSGNQTGSSATDGETPESSKVSDTETGVGTSDNVHSGGSSHAESDISPQTGDSRGNIYLACFLAVLMALCCVIFKFNSKEDEENVGNQK